MKNPTTLKTNLQSIYNSFESEARNFRLFVHIYEYIDSIKTNPLLKDKIKEYESITADSLLNTLDNKESTKEEIDQDFDIFSQAIESVGAYWVLYAVYEIMRKYKDKEQVKLKEKIDNDFTKKYRKFLDFLLYSLHEDLMEYLDELELLGDYNNKIVFDNQKSILHIKGKKVKIKRKADLPIEHYILEYLFEQQDKTEEVYYQDIAKEKLRELEYNNKTDWKKYYNACERLQDKIRVETNINDFIIFTTNKTGNVKINKKYLEYLG